MQTIISETIIDLIERAMMQCPNNKGFIKNNRIYLGGFVDGLHAAGVINDEARRELYGLYGPR